VKMDKKARPKKGVEENLNDKEKKNRMANMHRERNKGKWKSYAVPTFDEQKTREGEGTDGSSLKPGEHVLKRKGEESS